MKTYPLATSLCFLTLTLAAPADTFIMKDGTKLEGSILREDATSYVLEVQVTKTIKDERKVAKADVVKIDHDTKAVVPNDFATISGLVPVPDMQPAEEYAKRIKMVEKFIAEHRMTAKSKDAEAMLATLKAETNEILAGAIKLNGKMIPPAEYRTNKYDIDARIQEVKLRKLVKEAKLLAALRAFGEFEHDFRNTSAFNELLPLINQVVAAYLTERTAAQASFDARAKERRIGLERMTPADRRVTEAAIQAESAELEKRFKAEKDAKLVWVTQHPFFKPALDDTLTSGAQEQVRLKAMGSEPVVDGGRLFRDAMNLAQGKSDTPETKAAIAAAIAKAKTAMLPQRYIDLLVAAVPGGVVVPSN